MQITRVCAIPMSDPVPAARQHRTDLGTKVKSDATLIRVETNTGLAGLGAALGTPPVVAAIVEHELAPDRHAAPRGARSAFNTSMALSTPSKRMGRSGANWVEIRCNR